MKPQLILFDFDYTLADASGCLFGALRKGLATVGVEPPADGVLKPLIGIPLEEQYRTLAGSSPSFSTGYPIFSKAYVSARNEGEEAGSILLPAVKEALGALLKMGFLLGIVSTGADGRIRRTLTRFGALAFFDDRIFGGASEKAAVIINAANQMGVGLARTLYVGDRPEDGEAAERAGVGFIAVTTGAFGAGSFPEGTRSLSSLSELPAVLLE